MSRAVSLTISGQTFSIFFTILYAAIVRDSDLYCSFQGLCKFMYLMSFCFFGSNCYVILKAELINHFRYYFFLFLDWVGVGVLHNAKHHLTFHHYRSSILMDFTLITSLQKMLYSLHMQLLCESYNWFFAAFIGIYFTHHKTCMPCCILDVIYTAKETGS